MGRLKGHPSALKKGNVLRNPSRGQNEARIILSPEESKIS
jgi:hypothetical protein